MAECDFTAGCVGGVAGVIVGHPFDTVKVRLQQQHNGDRLKYTGTLHCFRTIVKNETFFGLYKGVLSPLYGQIAINSMVFTVHGGTLKWWGDNGLRAQVAGGGLAGILQTVICSPMELVKIRMQMQDGGSQHVYTSTYDCVRKIFQTEGGLRGLFRGFRLTFWREVPSFAIYFGSYHWLCERTNAISSEEVSITKLLLCGGVAGILCWLPVYPFDVIKTRQQADGVMGRCKYNGIWDCTMQSYRNEGMAVFFRGMTPTLLRAFPTNAATLATVTIFMRLFCNKPL